MYLGLSVVRRCCQFAPLLTIPARRVLRVTFPLLVLLLAGGTVLARPPVGRLPPISVCALAAAGAALIVSAVGPLRRGLRDHLERRRDDAMFARLAKLAWGPRACRIAGTVGFLAWTSGASGRAALLLARAALLHDIGTTMLPPGAADAAGDRALRARRLTERLLSGTTPTGALALDMARTAGGCQDRVAVAPAGRMLQVALALDRLLPDGAPPSHAVLAAAADRLRLDAGGALDPVLASLPAADPAGLTAALLIASATHAHARPRMGVRQYKQVRARFGSRQPA